MAFQAPQTERLRLRRYREDDGAANYGWAGDEDNVAFMLYDPQTLEECREYAKWMAAEGDTAFIVERKADGLAIGSCGIEADKGRNDGEAGWILRKDCHGQGYGAELGFALLAHAFVEMGLRRVTAHCDAENAASWRLMEKLGMRREGRFVKARRRNRLWGGAWHDEFSYAILREEYDLAK